MASQNPKEFAFTHGIPGSIQEETPISRRAAMANGQLGQVLRQIRRLIGGPAVEAATAARALFLVPRRSCLHRAPGAARADGARRLPTGAAPRARRRGRLSGNVSRA